MLPFVILGVLILVVLFVLAALSWRFVLAIRAFFEWLAIPFTFLAQQIESAREACKRGIEHTLRWPPIRKDKKDTEEEYWKGIDVIGRLILLAVSICIFGADLPFTQQRSAFLLGIEHLTHINLPLDVLGGILWLAVPSLWGAVIFDLLGLIPRGTRLFPHVDNRAIRVCFATIAFLFFILALIDTAYFYYYGQYPILLSQSASGGISLNLSTGDIAQLGLFIVFAFGFVITGAAAIALWALILGLGSLVSVLLGLLYFVLSLCYLPLALIGKWVAGFGEMIDKSQPLYIIRRTVTLEARQVPQLTKVAESQEEYIEGSRAQQEEDYMDSKRNDVLIAYGHEGLEVLAQTLERVIHIRAEDCILAYGGIDQYQSTKPSLVLPSIRGAKNITPSAQEVGAHSSVSKDTGEAFESLTLLLVSKIKEAYAQAKCVTGTILIFADMLMAAHMVAAIERMKASLPMAKILIVTSLPQASQRNGRLMTAGENFLQLHRQEKIEAILLADPNSSLGRQKGQAEQGKFIALCVASLIVAPYHYRHNPPLPKLAELLGTASPVIGFSFETAHIAAGKSSLWWTMLRKIRPSLPVRGSGDVNDTMRQARLMIDTLGLQTTGYFITVLDIPIPLNDRRFNTCAENVTAYLARRFPHSGGIVVRENGIPEFRQGEGYFSTCTCLYPLTQAALLSEPEEKKLLESPTGSANGKKPHATNIDPESTSDSGQEVSTEESVHKESNDANASPTSPTASTQKRRRSRSNGSSRQRSTTKL